MKINDITVIVHCSHCGKRMFRAFDTWIERWKKKPFSPMCFKCAKGGQK